MDNELWKSIWAVLQTFIPDVEGFRSTPYWDNKQWTWGVGTRVPGSINDQSQRPMKTINKPQAMDEAQAHLVTDFTILSKHIGMPLKVGQWAALLSFSYEEGLTAATRLIPDIMSGDISKIEAHWLQYIYAAGKPNEDIKARRKKEMLMWKM